jgi:2'-5' RNA ligase
MAYSGVILAFFLRTTEAEQIALTGGEPVDNLHLTLMYLGDTEDFDPNNLCDLAGEVEKASYFLSPLEATVSGIGRFTNMPVGEKTPIYASVDCPQIDMWRAVLIHHLKTRYFGPNYEHGFTPHITLDYIDAADPMPVYSPPNISLHFDNLTLAIAGKRYSSVLRGDGSYEGPNALKVL